MKIEYQEHETGNIFQVKNDIRKITSMFATGFYSSPLYSSLREVILNAVDEHIKYNVERPVEVTVENIDYKKIQIRVRDFAKGLTQDEVRDIYTVFFHSEKEDSPTQWGAFGLGSKSPFAVTNEFYVTSYQNGIATKYKIFLDNFLPKYKVAESYETDEPDGLEVIYTADISQFYNFELKNLFSDLVTAIPNVHYNIDNDRSLLMAENRIKKVFYEGELDDGTKYLLCNFSGVIYSGNIFRNRLVIDDIVIYPKLGSLKLTPNREELIDYEDTLRDIVIKVVDDLKERAGVIEVYDLQLREFVVRPAFLVLSSEHTRNYVTHLTVDEIKKYPNDNIYNAFSRPRHIPERVKYIIPKDQYEKIPDQFKEYGQFTNNLILSRDDNNKNKRVEYYLKLGSSKPRKRPKQSVPKTTVRIYNSNPLELLLTERMTAEELLHHVQKIFKKRKHLQIFNKTIPNYRPRYSDGIIITTNFDSNAFEKFSELMYKKYHVDGDFLLAIYNIVLEKKVLFVSIDTFIDSYSGITVITKDIYDNVVSLVSDDTKVYFGYEPLICDSMYVRYYYSGWSDIFKTLYIPSNTEKQKEAVINAFNLVVENEKHINPYIMFKLFEYIVTLTNTVVEFREKFLEEVEESRTFSLQDLENQIKNMLQEV